MSPAVAIVIVPQRKRAAVAGVMFVFFMMIPLSNLPTAEAKALKYYVDTKPRLRYI